MSFPYRDPTGDNFHNNISGSNELNLLKAAEARDRKEGDERVQKLVEGLSRGGITQIREALIAAESGLIPLRLIRTVVARRLQGALASVHTPRDERETNLIAAWQMALSSLAKNEEVSVPFAIEGGIDTVVIPAIAKL